MNEDEKRQLLLKILSKKKQESVMEDAGKITQSHKTRFPLSMVQRGIWMDCLIDPDSAVYNIPFACKIKGAVDSDALKESVRRIIERHEIWRTVIYREDDEVFQNVLPEVGFDFRYFDRRVEKYNNEMVAEEAKRFVSERMDLEHGPLVRFALYQTDEEVYYFILSGHHIVYDGTSENLFCHELSAEYSSVLHDQDSSVERPTISYGDYAEFSLTKMGSEEIHSQIDYWKEELAGIEPTEFPTDFIRPAVRSSEGGMIYFDIPQSIEEKIRKYAISRHVTVNVVLFAALNSMLRLYTRDESISVEITVANRDDEQLEKLLGCFINNLVIVTQVNPQMTFDEVVSATKERIYGALENKDVPLETLVEAVNPPRDLSRTPFSEVGFNYNPRRRMDLSLEGCECEEFGLGDFVVLTDVNFQIHDDESLCGFLEYNRSLYERTTIERILERFMLLLDKLTEAPEVKIGSIEAVSAEERQQILAGFNDTATNDPREKTIVELFEEQVERTPDNIAVVYEDEKLTYRELNARANQLAYRLRDLGVKPDDLAAIIAERSIEMIVGIYGILKAGGAYLPMDPTYPEGRIAYMLKDAAPKAVLKYKAEIKTELPVIDVEDSGVYTGASDNPERVNTPENLAYCIYTSGTTGESKGVLIENRNLTAYVTQFVKYYGIDEKSVILQQAYLGFDTSIEELYPVLIRGGKMVVVDKEHLLNSEKMKETITNERINIISCSPLLIKEMDYLKDTELKTLISGGDVLKRAYFESIKDTGIGVYNTYGPTEATVCATYFKVNYAEDNNNVPIGKPIANSQVYMLNGEVMCGIGVPGELCIAGAGIARGYLNRPELTAEKFAKNPFGEGRMYRSGDLARWLPDGNIEYLGRIDEQVKIRGFRVELGEIESRIREIENLKDCAVIARADTAGEKAIYAYVVSEEETDVSKIRDVLGKTLPDYMLPSYMMQIESIPVTRNGKLDKRALPDIEARTGDEYAAPRNETEEIICSIFSEILNVEKVSIKDNFFALGGHSLRATRLVNRIEAQTGKRIPLKTIFSSPTPEILAEIINRKEAAEYTAIPRAEEKEYYPMSSAQKRTYLICQMDPGGILYNMPESFRLTGEVYPEALKNALQQLIDRHEILRTQFLMVDGEPVQKILDHLEADFEYFKDTKTDEAELIAGFTRPFDFCKLPLVRVQLVDRGEYHLLSIDMHHIVGDGMSAGTFTKELNALYNKEELQPLTHQFKDYSEWMRSRDLSGQAAYWKSRFEDEIPVLDMPLDFTRPQEQSYSGARATAYTGRELGEKIKKLATRTGSTEFMVFLSAVMVLLGKYSRQEDIVIGTPISGRTHKDTESMLGMFVNTLAMRGRPEGKRTYREFLKEIKQTCLKAYENQEYPFEELVEAVDVQRDLSRNPLFDVMLVLQNNEDEELRLGEARAQTAETKDTIAKIDLSFDIYEDDGDYGIGLEYCTALFRRESAEKILEHFMILLDKLTEAPEEKIGSIEAVSTEERQQILVDFNDTAADYPRDKTIAELFEEQVEKTPDNVAVVLGEEKLTYAELNQKANQLAYRLRDFGVKPNDFVAMLTERSLEMIVGICGIIKAGGAYVPMDPTYPEDRIAYMLVDAAPKAVLTYKTSVKTDIPVIDLADSEVYTGASGNPEHINTPNDLIYCIYTSGTTGKPKGVMIEHSGVNNLAIFYIREHNVGTEDKFLMFASYCFDASVTEIMTSLLSGAQLHVACSELRGDTLHLEKYISEREITIALLPPALLEQLDVKGPRVVITAGSETTRRIIENNKHIPVYSNDYGPTEGSVCATVWKYESGNVLPQRIPIGKPISNKHVYIVQGDTLCGIGMPGELCIAGDGIARGYLNRPELTEEKFAANPYGEGRMYHTGDLARWLPDGNIEYLGRIDEQVKIRGFRVELGEIESRIREIDKVKDCAVIARANAAGEKAIYAYVVSEEETDVSKIRDELGKTLPDYMIPSYMTQIESIPMTRNGKVDKRALPDIEARTGNEYVAPGNETEAIICRIFSEILNVEKVSIKDSFFSLGGHSLRATRLVNGIEAETGTRIALRNVFSSPTPEKLAELVIGKDVTEYIPIPRAEEKECYPMSSAQKRTYLICQMDPDGILYNMPQNLRLTGEVRPEALKNALQQLIDRHEILRTQFLMVDGEPVQKILDKVEADFKYIKDTEPPEAERTSDFIRPFDLGRVPLVRVRLVDRGEYHLLSIDMHHIVGDGMSMGTFVIELSALYNGEELEPLTHQFKDYSEWMRSRDLSGQAAYWKSQFKDEIPVLDMPLDFTRPQEQSYSGATVDGTTGKELCEKIKKLAAQTGVTEFMVLLSAAMVLLGKYSRQEDVVIGTPISGRTHKDTESMLGMFVNTLAMRGRPEGKKTYRKFLKEIKETCLKGYENQEYPFEELVEAVDVQRDMSRNPLFDVMLVLQNNESEELSLGGAKAQWAETEFTAAKFDLSFDIYEDEGEYGISLEYCTALFRRESTEKILEHFIVLLDKLTETPETKIESIEAISAGERELILKAFNDTAAEYPKDKTVAELLEEQAAKTPDNIAVVFEDEKLTYRELNARTNQLAHILRERYGVKPGDFVAMLTERSLEMIVGICGIIKAGGAYVPMDPTYPADRTAYMLEDAVPKAVLTYKASVKTDIPMIDLADSEVYTGASGNPEHVNTPNDLLYCIYTSGTTGTPKGVMIEHSGVNNLANFYIREHNIGTEDNFLMFASYCFDASVTEIMTSLLSGAQLHVASSELRGYTLLLENYIREREITIALLPPALLEQLDVRGPRVVITAGSETTRRIIENNRHIPVYSNDYGPTEGSVCATVWKYESSQVLPQRIPIGKPISNKHVYIVQGDTLCGIGMPGELCIAGDGIARGYLNKPDLTEEKFVNNPFGEGKMYHTGDLARWLPDGNIEYLGRIDEQVKIRGFRIELGEIESRIREIDNVKDCAVIAKNDINGEKAIYAYVVSDEEIRIPAIRDELAKSLPDYMIPSYMMQIASIPMTRNGKLDKRALPDIDASTGNEYVAPRNETEAIICRIFSEILNVDKVSIKDSFFALSGHSLRATKLVNRIEAETGRRIPLKAVFSSPTPEKLAEIVRGKRAEEFISIPHAEKKDYYPMSSAQKRTYMISQLDPDGIVYNMPENLRLKGEVHPEALKRALQQLIDRHEILRTQFLMVDGEPVQKILDKVEAYFEYIEDTKTPEEELTASFTRPFDLSRVPLVRVQLVDRGEYHLLNIDMHHIVGDGMSAATFTRELNALYNGEELSPLTHQFKDYSEWMLTRDLSSQADYWKRQFEDEIPVLDMPLDYARPQEQSHSGSMVFNSTGKELGEKIKKLAAQTGATEFMVLLSAAMVLLYKYSRQEDIVIGTPISGRTHKDTEGMLGMFINTLAMRGRPEGKKSYLEFLAEIKDTCLKGYENQEYPFEELVEAVDVVRDMSRNPLFDAILVLQNNENEEISLNGVNTEWADARATVAKLDLTFNIGEYEGDFGIGLEYCTALFKEESAENILSHYVLVLEELMENPSAKIGDVSVVSEDEKKRILNDFNDTEAEYPKDKTVAELFEEQVERTPDNIAVVFEDEKLTYRELNARANQLAYRLRLLGVKPDDCVVILADRSIEIVIGILAIIKAGGAYVPVDPTYPEDRIAFMLEDAAPKAILTYKATVNTDVPAIDLADAEVYSCESDNPVTVNKPEDIIYCIYTSGTTGKPKGVLVENRNVVKLIKNCDYTELNEKTIILQTGQMMFDASTFEVWGALTNGGSLHLISKNTMLNIYEFKAYLINNRVNTLFITTALFNQFISEDTEVFNSLEHLMFGGEATSERHVKILKEQNTNVDFRNVYGPTETTTFATHYIIESDVTKTPIGRPISNTTAYIIQGDSLCGIGVTGELCIGGDGVARGYLNRPELTDEKFAKNPFGEGRMYHTGDLARWLPDGNIEYLGRIDDQVKIRGFRIELGEIESRIRDIKNVKDSAVIVKVDACGEKAIHAYVVSDEQIDISKIRDELCKTMPEYMIPSYMMQIESIPVTRNGKLDRRALPNIEARTGKEYVAPRNNTERIIAAVFMEILGVDKVGIHDDFFALGGHSLKAIRVTSKLKLSNINISTKDLYTQKTIAHIANLLGEQPEDDLLMSSKVIVSIFEPQVIEDKIIRNNYLLDAIFQYKSNLRNKRVIKTYTPNYMQKYFVDISSEDPNFTGICLSVSGATLPDLKNALKQLVLTQSALRTCYSEDTGEMIEYEFGEWEIPYITASKAGSRETVSSFLFSQKSKSGEDILPLVLIVQASSSDFEVYIVANHALWDRTSCDIVSDFLEVYLNNGTTADPSLMYSDYMILRNSSDKSVNTKEEQEYFHKCIDSYKERSTGAYTYKSFNVTLKKDVNVSYDVRWLISKFSEISDTKDLNAIPFFTLYHCRDESSMNTIGFYVDYVACVYDKDMQRIRFYDEAIGRLKEGSADYRFLCDEYSTVICDDVVVVNLKETVDLLKSEDVNMIEVYNLDNQSAQEGIDCLLDNDTISVGMGFHMRNVSDEEFMRRIQKAFSIK